MTSLTVCIKAYEQLQALDDFAVTDHETARKLAESPGVQMLRVKFEEVQRFLVDLSSNDGTLQLVQYHSFVMVCSRVDESG